MLRKWCNRCRKDVDVELFGKNSLTKSGLSCYCKECELKRQKKEYKINRQKRIDSTMKHRMKNKEAFLEYTKNHRLKIRSKVLELYGGKCSCCNESIEPFLTMDHIQRDGHKHRKGIGSIGTYREMIRNVDHSKYRILCMNCNWAIRGGKVCPHQQVSKEKGE